MYKNLWSIFNARGPSEPVWQQESPKTQGWDALPYPRVCSHSGIQIFICHSAGFPTDLSYFSKMEPIEAICKIMCIPNEKLVSSENLYLALFSLVICLLLFTFSFFFLFFSIQCREKDYLFQALRLFANALKGNSLSNLSLSVKLVNVESNVVWGSQSPSDL